VNEYVAAQMRDVIYTAGILMQARIELESMLVANRQREIEGLPPAYGEQAFLDLRDRHCIYHNGLVTNLNEALRMP